MGGGVAPRGAGVVARCCEGMGTGIACAWGGLLRTSDRCFVASNCALTAATSFVHACRSVESVCSFCNSPLDNSWLAAREAFKRACSAAMLSARAERSSLATASRAALVAEYAASDSAAAGRDGDVAERRVELGDVGLSMFTPSTSLRLKRFLPAEFSSHEPEPLEGGALLSFLTPPSLNAVAATCDSATPSVPEPDERRVVSTGEPAAAGRWDLDELRGGERIEPSPPALAGDLSVPLPLRARL